MSGARHLWSGRFAAAPDADVFRFQASFAFDRRLFEDDVEGSLAWADALARAGVLSAGDAATIREGLAAILEAGRREPGFVAGDDEDVHAFVERKLIEGVGDVARRLHTGRSRNEQVSLDLRLYLRRRLAGVQRAVVGLVGGPGGPGRRRRDRADARVHASAPGAAGARRALLPRPRRRVAAGPRPPRAGPGRGRRRCRWARARSSGRATRSTSTRWPGGWGSRGWCRTAWTPRPTVTSSRPRCTPAPC